jgi:hypothetical protein
MPSATSDTSGLVTGTNDAAGDVASDIDNLALNAGSESLSPDTRSTDTTTSAGADTGVSDSTRTMARSLGWLSIALGALELLRPRDSADAAGSSSSRGLVQAYGLREITTGIGLLTARDPEPWLWARVGGDALDLATLITDLRSSNPKSRQTAIAIAAVLGVTVLDVLCAKAAHEQSKAPAEAPRDYSDRVGMPLSPEEMRGSARDSLEVPSDMQIPSALRPYKVETFH